MATLSEQPESDTAQVSSTFVNLGFNEDLVSLIISYNKFITNNQLLTFYLIFNYLFINTINNQLMFSQEGDLKASIQPELVGRKENFKISMTTTQPVTYSWENIEIYLETKQGNCFKRLPSVQKRILNNGEVITKLSKYY